MSVLECYINRWYDVYSIFLFSWCLSFDLMFVWFIHVDVCCNFVDFHCHCHVLILPCSIALCEYITIYLFKFFNPTLPFLGIYCTAIPTGEHKDRCARCIQNAYHHFPVLLSPVTVLTNQSEHPFSQSPSCNFKIFFNQDGTWSWDLLAIPGLGCT